jgi:hypothetical protein
MHALGKHIRRLLIVTVLVTIGAVSTTGCWPSTPSSPSRHDPSTDRHTVKPSGDSGLAHTNGGGIDPGGGGGGPGATPPTGAVPTPTPDSEPPRE